MESEPDGHRETKIYRLAELNTEQIRSLDRDKTVVLIPGGIIEEHGPYLSCCTDVYGSELITEQLANVIVGRPGWNSLIFPTIPLGTGGANTIGGKPSFPGSCTVRATTVRAVFMDLASELGEQGFRWIFVVAMHGAPSNNKALNQACAYFSDVYGGRMVNLLGVLDLLSLLEGVLTTEDQEVAGMDVHAGTLETGWMLAFHPARVDPAYKKATPQSGKSWDDLRRIASAPGWPGYLGAPALASASYGASLQEKTLAAVTALAMRILDGEEPDAEARRDRTPFNEEAWAHRKQQEWLEQNGLA